MKNICMVTTSEIYHDSRILNEAAALAKKYQVTILAKKYPNQIKIAKPFAIKLISYRKFGPRFDIFSGQWALMRQAFRENPDIFHAHDLDGLLCSFPAALIKHKVLIYDSHELWSKIFPFRNQRGIQWLLGPLERLLMAKVKAGLTVNQSLADYLSRRYKKEFLAIYNYPIKESSLKKGISLKKIYPGKKIILHLGSADEGRGLEQIIHSAQYLARQFVVVFLGGGKTEKEAKILVDQLKLKDKVHFLPAVLPEEIIASISEADLGLALTQKVSLSYYYSLPNKIFQYSAAGIPILGSNFPEFKKIIVNNQIGEVVDPAKPQKIAQKIIKMLQSSNQKKYRSYLEKIKERYNFYLEGIKLANFYKNLFNEKAKKR